MWDESKFSDEAIGPIGLHDARLLSAICAYVKPRIVIEYGGLLGHSLSVFATHAEFVISVDEHAGVALQEAAKKAGNAQVVKGKMEEYDPVKDGVKAEVDLIFVDAAHLLDKNIACYEKVCPLLSPHAMILVHDTGPWKETDLPPQWAGWVKPRAELLSHDRSFVLYLRGEDYRDVTFGTNRHLRHGITVCMKPQW